MQRDSRSSARCSSRAIVARVRITSGNTPIGATVERQREGRWTKRDIVAMDDFIYGEPRPPTDRSTVAAVRPGSDAVLASSAKLL